MPASEGMSETLRTTQAQDEQKKRDEDIFLKKGEKRER